MASFAQQADRIRQQELVRVAPVVARARQLKTDGRHPIWPRDLESLSDAQKGLAEIMSSAASNPRYAKPSSTRAAVRFGAAQVASGAAAALTAAALGPAAGFIVVAGLMAQDAARAGRAVGGMARGAHGRVESGSGFGRHDVLSARGAAHPLNRSDPKDQGRVLRAWRDVDHKRRRIAQMMERPSMDAMSRDVMPFWQLAEMGSERRAAMDLHGGYIPLKNLVWSSARYVVGSHEPRLARPHRAPTMPAFAPTFH